MVEKKDGSQQKKEMPPRLAASPLKNGGLEIGQEGLVTG